MICQDPVPTLGSNVSNDLISALETLTDSWSIRIYLNGTVTFPTSAMVGQSNTCQTRKHHHPPTQENMSDTGTPPPPTQENMYDTRTPPTKENIYYTRTPPTQENISDIGTNRGKQTWPIEQHHPHMNTWPTQQHLIQHTSTLSPIHYATPPPTPLSTQEYIHKYWKKLRGYVYVGIGGIDAV